MNSFSVTGSVPAVSSQQVKWSPIGLGFEKLDRNVFDPEKAYDKVAKLGVKWVRIQSGWARTETEKGNYDFAWLDSIVDNLLKRGLTPWVCLCYGNALYSPAAETVFGAVGIPPIATAEEKIAWANYVAALTKHFTGRVSWYEVWNEPDGNWCWKHGANGTEYGEFVKDTAAAARQGDKNVKIIAGSYCSANFSWLNAMFQTGAGAVMDGFTYHSYNVDEIEKRNRVAFLKSIVHSYNAEIKIIQGETGTQSRSDGAGALRGFAWTPERQAKFLARNTMIDLFDQVYFSSYFTCVDMIEALNGTVGDKSSYLDYGYFGVLAADFDADGFATGDYTPKLSYRSLQVIASIFREEFKLVNLPILPFSEEARIIGNQHTLSGKDFVSGGFQRPDGSGAYVYWKPTNILTETFDGRTSLNIVNLPKPERFVDLVTGDIHAIPADKIEDISHNFYKVHELPIKDYPLALIFGNFLL